MIGLLKAPGSGEVDRYDGLDHLKVAPCDNPWRVYDCWKYLPIVLQTLPLGEANPRNRRSLDLVEGWMGR